MRKIIVLALLAGLFLFTSQELLAQKKVTFENVFDGTFSAKGYGQFAWMKSGGAYSNLNGDKGKQSLTKHSIVDESVDTLMKALDFKFEGKVLEVDDYSFSSDESKVLLETESERLWRRSTRGVFYIFDLNTREMTRLTSRESKQSYAEFSPNSSHVAYFSENNLFLVDLSNYSEKAITTDGKFNHIINGAADWVYEEEFSFAKAYFWAPDGKKIAFYRFDESDVKEFNMMDWDTPYPDVTKFKYPKAGEKNSIVTIATYDIASGDTKWMDVGEETDQYIVRINWTQNPEKLSIRRLNRLQNKQDLLIADATTGTSTILKTESSDTWIDENDDLTFLEGGKQFIYVSEEDGRNHIYLYDVDGKLDRQITKGDWDVTEVVGVDQNEKTIYYISNEKDSKERHFYSIRLNGRKKQLITEAEGWHSVNMAPDFSVYIVTLRSPSEPSISTLYDKKGKEIRVLQDNAELKEKLAEFSLPTITWQDIPAADGTPLNSFMILPPDFDSTKSYPMLMHVYGGPGSQQVTKRFFSGQRAWYYFLASEGFIVACVDNRGTGGKGAKFKKQIYKQLGKLETEDQISAAKYLSQRSYIDESRIGIFGWSYGGYMSSLSLAQGGDIFSLAIAVAPVTNWKFYDTIYTERFMQTPQLNPDGYKNGSPLTYAKDIKGDYLLIHGTGDDNVHFQNAIEMNEALVQANIPFQTMYYRNRNHGIYGGNTSKHLYDLMTRFLKENL